MTQPNPLFLPTVSPSASSSQSRAASLSHSLRIAFSTAGIATLVLFLFTAGCSFRSAEPSHVAPPSPALSAPVVGTPMNAVARSPRETAQYVGDAACAPCHRDLWRTHLASGHAKTLMPVSTKEFGPRFRGGNSVRDVTNDTTYRADVLNDRCVMIDEGPVGRKVVPAEWALGSGRHGQTFLGREKGAQWVTLRLSYYNQIRKWDFTPSQRPDPTQAGEANGHSLSVGETESCLSCHVTTLTMRWDGPDPSASRFGVGCERCHGPGRSHIALMRSLTTDAKGAEIGMAKLHNAPPSQISALCGECHRAESTPRPGDPDLSRFKSTALEMSACFQKSRTLTCVTCHDPHTRVTTGESPYEAACLSCHHQTPASALSTAIAPFCKVNPRHGCIPCHMPAQTMSTFPHTVLHNHWIRVWNHS